MARIHDAQLVGLEAAEGLGAAREGGGERAGSAGASARAGRARGDIEV